MSRDWPRLQTSVSCAGCSELGDAGCCELPHDEMSVQGSALSAELLLTLELGATVNHPH